MRPRPAIAVLAAAAAAALAAPANASTVFVSGGDAVDYNAEPGEANNLTVSRSGGNYVITDPGATITPIGATCASVSASQATCPALGIFNIDATLGDLGDTGTIDASVTGAELRAQLQGGTGGDTLNAGPNVENDLFGDDDSDTLIGSDGRDRIGGGDGDDTMSGAAEGDFFDASAGTDTIDAGAGDDSFGSSGQPDGPDTFIGGPGDDGLDQRQRRASLFIDGDGVADDGENCPGAACEGDNVMADVEEISSGRGDDTIVGGDVRNTLFGGPGDDLVEGGGEGDLVFGEDGNDTVAGGFGDDEVRGDEGIDMMRGDGGDDLLREAFVDGTPDAFSGGKGTDLASFPGQLPQRIDLDGDPDDGENCPGAACEGDNVMADVEELIGGDASDVLKGSKRANDFSGGAGADRLVGGGGADGLHGEEGGDNLNGGKGRDLLEGDSGSDRIKSRDGGPDEVSCGSSRDVVKADGKDRTGADCDKVKRGGG